MNDVSLIDIDF
jgi:ubiquitin C-terminal hydrolase